MTFAHHRRVMTITMLTPAAAPAREAHALAPFLAVAGALSRVLRYVLLIPALILAALPWAGAEAQVAATRIMHLSTGAIAHASGACLLVSVALLAGIGSRTRSAARTR